MSTLSNPTAETRGAKPTASTGAHPMAKSLPAGPRLRPPTHPGEVIADVIEGAGVSMREAARAIGMSQTGLIKALKGESPVTAETAARLEVYFGNPHGAELWLNMQRDYDLWHARQTLRPELATIEPLPNSHPAPKRKAG